MRICLTFILMVFALTVFGDEIRWAENLEQGKTLSSQKDKHLFIYICNDQAPDCLEFNKKTLTNTEVTSLLNDKFVCVQFDGIKEMDTAAFYRVNRVPTVLVLDPSGKEVLRYSTFKTAIELIKGIRPIVYKATPTPKQTSPIKILKPTQTPIVYKDSRIVFQEPFDLITAWRQETNEALINELTLTKGAKGNAFKIDYQLKDTGWSWVTITRVLKDSEQFDLPEKGMVVLDLAGKEGATKLDLKFIDEDGTVFGKSIDIPYDYRPHSIILPMKEVQYMWGGSNKTLGKVTRLEFSITPNPGLWNSYGLGPKGLAFFDDLVVYQESD